MLLMLKDDGNGGSSLRDGGEGLRMDSEGLGAMAGIYIYIYMCVGLFRTM